MTHPMNTPRTALEECLRLADLATPPGEWKYSPWHVEEGPSAVLSTDGWAVCHTSSDTTAALIAAAINLLRTHGKALSEALGGWLPIETAPTGCFVMAISRLTGRVMPLWVIEEENDLAERFTHWHRINLAELPAEVST